MSALSRFLRMATLALVVGTLGACTLSREQVRRAETVIASQQDRELRCTAADACALVSPYRELVDRAAADSRPDAPVHYVNLLDQGADALALRVHLIRAARRSIDVQTFIFAQDDAGLLTLDELINAARRGVKVRVIADQLFSIGDPTLLARLARAHANFEIRFYNPTFDEAATQPLEFAAGILCCFFKFNQRMHNKLLLVDGEIGIAGGRNYENRYYDWDSEFDYRDRDVLVTGPIAAAAMQASFDQFWNHDRTRSLARLKDINRRVVALKDPVMPWTAPVFQDKNRVAALVGQATDAAFITGHFIRAAFRVGRVDYFSDSPNKPLEPENRADQELTRHIAGLLRDAHGEIVMQTPYLVISKQARKIFRDLHAKHPAPHVLVSTNSLAATDAFYVYALSHKYKKRYLKRFGFEIHEFKPFPADATELVAGYASLVDGDGDIHGYQRYGQTPVKKPGVRLGLHAKSIVIDGQITLIGSHNFDPRSDDFNTEAGFIIHDAAFAQAVRASILRDAAPRNAWTIAKRPRPKLLDRVNNAISDFSTALPMFDFWPFRYASSFELKPGCQPLPPKDPHFYECYEDVGDFPEVDLPMKTIYTRIITAFGAGLISIL